MEYTISRLAKLSGISVRTLRYYDQIGLLTPARTDSNNYRVYKSEQVDMLQQILFYKELGVGLLEIKALLYAPEHDLEEALEGHLAELQKQKMRIDLLIKNVQKTIGARKGEITMNDQEKFEGLKQSLIDENEKKYGKELRQLYGDNTIDAANEKTKKMSNKQYLKNEELTKKLNDTLLAAFHTGDPAGVLAHKACEMHKDWLCAYWPDGIYNAEVHMALAQGYVDDSRFTAYYDKIAPGCAVFLRDAVNAYYKEKIVSNG